MVALPEPASAAQSVHLQNHHHRHHLVLDIDTARLFKKLNFGVGRSEDRYGQGVCLPVTDVAFMGKVSVVDWAVGFV
jgi:hypothetical protein